MRSGNGRHDIVLDLEVGVDVLGVVVVVERVVELEQSLGCLRIRDRYCGGRLVDECLGFGREPFSLQDTTDIEKLVHGGENDPILAIVLDIVSPGFECEFRGLILGEIGFVETDLSLSSAGSCPVSRRA